MVANDVIRIGRRRTRHDSMMALSYAFAFAAPVMREFDDQNTARHGDAGQHHHSQPCADVQS